MNYLAPVNLFRYIGKGKLLLLLFFVVIGCQKKGNFVDEDRLGAGVSYYPEIVNTRYVDTLSEEDLLLTDSVFPAGQKLIFDLSFLSIDSVDQIELWAVEIVRNEKGEEVAADSQKTYSTQYRPEFYSEEEEKNLAWLTYETPSGLDSTFLFLKLVPKVITVKGLEARDEFTLRVENE